MNYSNDTDNNNNIIIGLLAFNKLHVCVYKPLFSRHFPEPVDESSMFVHVCAMRRNAWPVCQRRRFRRCRRCKNRTHTI